MKSYKENITDYFKLPFEVYYGDYIAVTILEFRSDIEVKKFEDIKIVNREQGGATGITFYCNQNKGPELYCCIHNLHDEIDPDWLIFFDEESVDMDSGDNFAIAIINNEVSFRCFTESEMDEDSDQFFDVKNMYSCGKQTFLAYEIGESSPDYIVLDSNESRIKIDLEGYEIDDKGVRTEHRIFDPSALNEQEYEDYTRLDMWEAKSNWLKSNLADFPDHSNLKLSYNTE